MALTAGNPPLASRMDAAMRWASGRSVDSRFTLYATRKKRDPIPVTPAVGWTAFGP